MRTRPLFSIDLCVVFQRKCWLHLSKHTAGFSFFKCVVLVLRVSYSMQQAPSFVLWTHHFIIFHTLDINNLHCNSTQLIYFSPASCTKAERILWCFHSVFWPPFLCREAKLFVGCIQVSDDNSHHISQGFLTSWIESGFLLHYLHNYFRNQL